MTMDRLMVFAIVVLAAWECWLFLGACNDLDS